MKPPMPLPISQHSGTITNQPGGQKQFVGPYENYDIPKTPVQVHALDSKVAASLAMENYDTPKKIQEYLTKDMNSNPAIDIYGNYDMPAVVNSSGTANMCGCLVSSEGISDTTKPNHALSSGPRADCTCNRVMSWADTWITLPYCRRGNGIENTGVPINKVKLSGEGKMPVVQPSGELAIYATVDMTKKIKKKLLEEMKACECPHDGDDDNDAEDGAHSVSDSSNYINLEPGKEIPVKVIRAAIEETVKEDPRTASNYMNLEFALSLENYENAKEVLQRAGFNVGELEETLKQCMPHTKICHKCGHASKRKQSNGPNGDAPSEEVIKNASAEAPASEQTQPAKPEDYMLMEPGKNNGNFPGYLPMSPATPNGAVNAAQPAASPQSQGQQPPPLPTKTELMKRILGEKSASNPSLGPAVDRSRKRADQEARVPGSAMMLLHKTGGSPYMRKQLMDNSDLLPIDKRLTARKRSSSADSSRFLEETAATEDFESSETLRKSVGTIDTATTTCLARGRRASSPCLHQERETCQDLSFCGSAKPESTERTEQSNTETEDETSLSINQSQTSHQSVYIRRSASVPCKAQNRDSSSSNDSGVSTGSMRHRTGEYTDFELPLTTAMSTRRHQRHAQHPPLTTVHASLPRRSKSFDPLREINFQFQRGGKFAEKSTSAEAEIPICPPKGSAPAKAGFNSPNDAASLAGTGQPYIDSRSTSSGTSDMSDYIETLSLSSHSSSDTPEGLR